MNCRPSLIFCLLLALLGLGLADVSGPDPAGQPARHAPVLVAGKVSPSPQTSPGVVQNIGVDSLGAVLTNITTAGLSSLLTTDLDSNGSTNVTTGAGVALLVPAAGGPVTVGGSANGVYIQGALADDAVTTTNPVLIGGRAYGADNAPSGVGTNGDVITMILDSVGRVRSLVSGPYAHDAAVGSQNPLLTGFTAEDVLPAAVTEGDAVRASATSQGQLRTIQDINANAVGYDAFRSVSLTNVSLQVKASAGICGPLRAGNPNSQAVWLHVYNTANASVTVGTTTPLCSYYIPANGTIETPGPITHSTAITLAVTNTSGGTEAPGTNLTVSGGYK